MTKSLAGAARVLVVAALTSAILPWSVSAQQADDEVVLRAVPAAVVPPQVYGRAVERDWRREDGAPGGAYWQQGSSYDL
jgi:hypothetical protein